MNKIIITIEFETAAPPKAKKPKPEIRYFPPDETPYIRGKQDGWYPIDEKDLPFIDGD
jgi:hypothetical protein